MDNIESIIALIKQEVVPALGCTEPAAVALASAHAASLLEKKVVSMHIFVSPNIFKNGMGVGIPGTGAIGLEIAAALGGLIADPKDGLEVLATASPSMVISAKQMLQEGRVKVEYCATDEKIYIEAVLSDGEHTSRAVIRSRHSQLTCLELDGKVHFYQDVESSEASKLYSVSSYSLEHLFDFAATVDTKHFHGFDLGEKLNFAIAEYGLQNQSGIAVGRILMDQIQEGILGDDIHNYAMALTSAATDARMSGCTLPVISNTGSGNQGLSITLPIIAVSKKLGTDSEALIRALLMGHLVSVYIKDRIGILSCLCGCISAAAGAASGIVMLLGGDYSQVEYAIKNMVGNTAGMVCDGAKEGCSLKVATNTSAAVQSAILATKGKCISANDGIVTESIDETIENLAQFVNLGMLNADSTILSIMMNKKKI